MNLENCNQRRKMIIVLLCFRIHNLFRIKIKPQMFSIPNQIHNVKEHHVYLYWKLPPFQVKNRGIIKIRRKMIHIHSRRHNYYLNNDDVIKSNSGNTKNVCRLKMTLTFNGGKFLHFLSLCADLITPNNTSVCNVRS